MESLITSNLIRLFPKEGRVLFAVSGGIDSMCMAAAALEAGLAFDVAHCNFSLRGDESDADESLVCSWCFDRGVFCHVARFDTLAYARKKSISTEMAARELRYGWFSRLCREKGYAAVFVAHNANDNAETLLLNLVRGTGIRGICGMAELSSLPVGNESLVIVRPLLDVPRSMIRDYVNAMNVPFREDGSNSDIRYKRNRIRHNVIPQLEELNSSVLRTLSADMAHFREVADIADSYYDTFMASSAVTRGGDGTVRVNISSLKENKHWKYLIFRLMESCGFSSSDVDNVYELIASGNYVPGKMFYGKSVLAYFAADGFVLSGTYGGWDPIVVTRPGIWVCGCKTIEVSVLDASEVDFGTRVKGVFLDADKIGFPIGLRPWQNGDWMCPLGMHSMRRKLSDIFVSLKVAAPEKHSKILVEFPSGDGHIAAIVDYGRIDEAVRVSEVSSRVIKIAVREDAR